jgi:hypothetical protein
MELDRARSEIQSLLRCSRIAWVRLESPVAPFRLHLKRCGMVGTCESNPSFAFRLKISSPRLLRIRPFDLTRRCDFDLRLPFVQLDCAGDADDFPLERGDLLVSRHV